MSNEKTLNMARGFGFMAGVLAKQQDEHLCGACISYTLSVEHVREALAKFRDSSAAKSLEGDFRKTFDHAATVIDALRVPEGEPLKQRKIGACHLPEKVCYVKYVKKLFIQIEEQE